ncbi:MAG: RICIN domain-containing protein [Clostridia bacterium]|nr:RICIN domain-containing protein [Clostridia bacterium]
MMKTSRFVAVLIAVIMILTNLAIPNVFASSQTDLSYPAQTVKIMAYGGARALNITGYGDNSKLNTYHLNGTQNENWRIDYVSDGVYEIVNVAADRLVSLEGNSATANTYCVLKTKSGDNTQKWKIEGVEKDFVGNYLYYKITNYANSNLALTWNTVTHEITVKSYTGANNQKWKLNLDGLEGFAGNCVVDEGEKAGTIGGLLGKTVFVSTSAQFKENLMKTEPLTIVVTENISDMGTADKEFRIEDNKTVIGSYAKNTLHDPRLVTSDYWQEYENSHNIVLKNLTFSVETVEDRMAISVYGSKNVWIDHCTFTSQLGLYYDEVGKYIWINEEASTGKNPDFVTISYNVFNRRYWGVAFGANALGEDRATVMYNKFVSIVNRAPQLGNGKLHVVNNYYVIAEAALENDGYGSIKCGDGSEVYSDAQRFEGYKKEASGYWDNEFTTGSSNTLKDVGSYTDRGETPVSTPYPYAVPSGTTAPTWNPSSNYGYKIMSAYGTNDVKAFCNEHSGVATSFDDLKYINYSDCSQYVAKTVSNPVAFDYTDPSDEATETPKEPIEAVCDLEDGIYMIKNKYSGLYLEVADANASNGANVQQGSATFPGEGHNQWKIVSTGAGYYQFYPQIGDGNLALDVDYSNAADGTNVQIWNNDNSDGKFFKINKESDGTYAILTKASVDTSGLDVSEMSKADGANVLQWTYSGASNQKWIFEKVTESSTDSDDNNNSTTAPSYSSDTVKDGAVYMIKNVNSNLYLDVNEGLAQSGTNVQQWGATFPGSGNNNWKIVSSGDGYYQLYPQIGEGNLVLDVASANAADGTNVQIWGNDQSNGKYFKFQLNDDGTYSILTKASNGASCLDVYNLSKENGGNVVQWTYTGGTNQKWILEMVREPGGTINGRYMEYLDRGVVAVRNGNSVFVSWRLLESDDPMVGFNVYRTTDGATVKLNQYPLYGGTNYTDTTADVSKNNTYFVKTVSDGTEESTAGNYTIPANSVSQAITIPIKAGGTIHFVWVGDFNADGKYDYLLDRVWDDTQKLEAYLHDGTYLWTIDMGYNSRDKDNQIEPAPAVIDVGMWDGATVYDIDCDGSAEIMLRVADGVVFGDGSTYTNSTTNGQAIAVINGMTGKLETSAPVPDDMISAGPKACMMEIGYLDGVNPSLVCWLKNRNDDKTFNSYMVAYGYVNGQFKQQWKYNNNKGYAEAHNIRIADVDYDGKDEVLHMGYALNGDGSLRYTVDKVVHGDRWYVGSFSNDNNNNEMMGYGIQQDNPNGLLEYFYNASTGKLIWTHYAASGTADVARGNVGDVDPNYDGFECWSFQGLYSMNNEQIHTDSLYPVLRLWWDGDLLSESFNDGKIEEWDYNNKWTNRVLTTWNVTDCVRSDRGVPMFYGDILGDWREEFIMTSADYSKLVIFSTTIPTDYRLDCLAQNPCYRNCMTGKGYYQSHMLDYFLGSGMEFPNGGESDDYIYSTADFQSTGYTPITNGVIEMDILPLAQADNVIGITSSTSNPTWYDQLNIVINLAADGTMKAYNGGALASYSTVPYEANKKYHLYIETRVSDKTYSAWITDEAGNKYTLALDYAYRSSAPEASDLGKLTLVGGWEVGGKLFAVSNVQFYNTLKKKVTYILNDANGNEVERWTDGPRSVENGDILYNFPQGEVYGEINNKAYIVKSATEQVYTVADDGKDEHTVTLEIVRENAVLTDTFADVEGNGNNSSTDMLFVGSAGVADAADTDADGNATVTGNGYNLSNPRVPLLTFNVPDDYENGKAVKLNVYVAKAHTHLGGGNSMKLAAGSYIEEVNENSGYYASSVTNLSDIVWSDAMFRLAPNTENVNAWVSIDVTEYVQNATGNTVTFALYAPRAAAYVVDRESASGGGAYMGKAAYLSVVEGETITTTGMEKVTKNGSVVKNKASFVVPVNSTVKFYAPSNVGAYAVTNGTDSFALTDNVTASVNPTAGKYYVTYLYSGTIYSTVGTEEGFVTTNHGPITKGVIDMDITPTAVNDGVIAISSSTSNPT